MKHLLWTPIILLSVMAGCKKDKPATAATLTTATPSNITANTAQIGGAVTSNGGTAITKSGICWALHASPTVGDSITVDGPVSGSFVSPLNNLASNTTYYVRAYAINAVGTGYGSEVNFTTAKGLATLKTNAISNIVPFSAQSGGNIISDGGAAITDRGICWSTSAHPTTANFKFSDKASTASFTDSITPIGSQLVYYVRAYAINSYGTAYGNEVSFTSSSANAVTDIDGNVYPYITIGTQTWMTRNLKTAHYRNGDSITNGVKGFDWLNNFTGAYSFPNGDSINNASLGKLYNIYAVQDSRNICPVGWHVPSEQEWETLEFFEGMAASDTGKLYLRGTIGMKFLEGGSSGLNLQKGGYLYPDVPIVPSSYDGFNIFGGYHSSTRSAAVGVNNLFFRFFNISTDPGQIFKSYSYYGLSVRCVKD